MTTAKAILGIFTSATLFVSLLANSPAKGFVQIETIRGFAIDEGSDGSGAPRTNLKAMVEATPFSQIPCKGSLDPNCEEKYLSAAAYLIPCSSVSTVACISEVFAVGSNGQRIQARYIRSVAKDPEIDFVEDPEIKLPTGEGMGGLWQFAGITHAGSTDIYAVQARITGNMTEDFASINYTSAQFGISAVRQESGNFASPKLYVDSEGIWRGFDSVDSNCVLTEANTCYRRVALPTGYRFGIKVKLPNALSGWFHGRIAKPEFKITTDIDGSNFYEVIAEPVTVPGVSKLIPYASWSPEFRSYASEQWPFSNGSGVLLPGNFGRLSLELTKRFLPMVEDKATNSSSFWVVRTLDEWADGRIVESIDQKIKTCSEDVSRVSGIVTTNAMVYSAGPPSFNEATQSLDYTVLSPHLDEKGKENEGSYDLLLDSKVARCIYGFSDAPIKAELEIIGSDGNTKVATTILGERDSWLFLSANGFTFSDPTVRVRLSQSVVSPEPVVSPTPTPIQTQVSTVEAAAVSGLNSGSEMRRKSKKVTITCVRGTASKKVTALKPKCPKGFKKSKI